MGFPKKISQLPLNLSLKSEDLFVTVNDNDVTSKIKLEQLISFVTGGTNTFVTGGTYNDITKNIDFIGTSGFPPFSVSLTGISTSDTFVTGATLNGFTLEIDRNNGEPQIIVDLSSLTGDTDTNTFITGTTLVGTTYTLERNDGVDITTDLNPIISGKVDTTLFDTYTANTVDNNIFITGTTLVGTDYTINDNNGTSFTTDFNPIVSGFTTGSTLQEVLENGSIADLTTADIDFRSSVSNPAADGFSRIALQQDGLINLESQNAAGLFGFLRITGQSGEAQLNQGGIKYGNDYSGTFTNRSLVDKEYVDGNINNKLDITTFNDYTANTTDNVVTGATLVSGTLELERNNGLPDVTVDLSSLSGDTDTFVTGATLTNTTLGIERNDGIDINVDLSSIDNNIFVNSGSANAGTQQLIFTNTSGGTFNVTNSAALFSDNDINVTGGTYNPTNGCVTFGTNSGTTFDVCGFVTGFTDVYVTGSTLVGTNYTLTRTDNTTISTDFNPIVSGKVDTTTFNSYSAITQMLIDTKLDKTIFNTYTADTTDNVVTGATLVGTILELGRNNGLSDVTVNLSSITGSVNTNTFVTGSTLIGETYTLKRNDGVDISTNFNSIISGKVDTTLFDIYSASTQTEINNKLDITSFNDYTANTTDNVVTGATLIGTTLELERNNGLSDVSIDLSSLTGSVDTNTFVSGATLVGTNYILKRNDGVDITTDLSSLTGETSGDINTGNVLWVDSIFGDDGTAVSNRQDLPYLTVEQALNNTTNGDTVIVRPGEYAEEGMVISEGVSLVSEGGWEVTILGKTPATATDSVIELNESSFIDGFSINVPQSGFNGINSINISGTSTANNITFYGNGGAGSTGIGLNKTGGGKLIGYSIRIEEGGMETALKVDSGVLALEGVHVPQSNGNIDNVLLVTTSGGTNAGISQMVGFNCGSNNITNAIRTEGGSAGVIPVVKIFTPNISNSTNALSASGDYEDINLLGGSLENVTYSVKVDLTGTGIDASYRITSNHQPNYIYPPAVAYTAEFGLDFTQESTDEFNSSKNLFGLSQMSLGFAEKGTELNAGRGAPSTVGMKVFTTDNTASSANDGGNITDVTDDAKSKEGSTITFQSGGTNTTILFTTQRISSDLTTPLKYYGIDLNVLQKKVGGEYVFEYWNGTEWVEDLVHIHSADLGYSYGNELFLRSQSDENLVFDLGKDSWSAKTINGVNGFWMRCRTVSTGTTKPTIEQSKIIYDSSTISKDGVLSFNGKSLYKEVTNLYNGTWGYAGVTLSDYNVTVGSGVGLQTWTHEFLDSQIGTGEAANFVLKIPQGTSTSQKVNVNATYTLDGSAADTTAAELAFSFLPVEVANIRIADSEGSKEPVPRIVSATTAFNVDAAQLTTPITEIGEDKMFQSPLGSFDISDYYEGDIVLMRLEKDAGTSVNFNLVSLDFEVSKWSLGKQSEGLKIATETIFSEDWADFGVGNGWQYVQDTSEENLWIVSSGTSRSGDNSAYITNDSGGTNVYEYTVDNTQNGAHLYVDFSIPSKASSLTINFYWTAKGENGGGATSWDYGRVGLLPTSVTPAQNTEFSSTYRIGADSNLNKFNLGYNGGAFEDDWQLETIPVSNSLWTAGEDRRLCLTWKSDFATGVEPPFAVADISIDIQYIE